MTVVSSQPGSGCEECRYVYYVHWRNLYSAVAATHHWKVSSRLCGYFRGTYTVYIQDLTKGPAETVLSRTFLRVSMIIIIILTWSHSGPTRLPDITSTSLLQTSSAYYSDTIGMTKTGFIYEHRTRYDFARRKF